MAEKFEGLRFQERGGVRANRRCFWTPLIIALTLFAQGCLIGPDFKTPPTLVADKWVEQGNKSVDSRASDYRDWWAVFNDPRLTRLIQLAYQQNLTLQTAGARVLEARARLGIAIGEFYPQQQQVGASLTYNRIPVSLPYNFITNTYWADQLGAQVAWELDLWGKLRRTIESADSAFLASVANYDDVLVTLIGDVARTYVQIRTTEQQIVIARQNLERQRTALKIATAKFRYGTASRRDVYQAENVLGATEATIPQLNIKLAEAKNALAVLLGMPPGRVDDLLAGSSDIPTAPEEVIVGIPADLLRRRPDVRRAELQAAAQSAQIGVAKADLLPTFSLIGNVGTLATDVGSSNLGNIFTRASLHYSVGPGIQWNLLNYGRVTNNVRVQDAKFEELLIDYRNTVLKAQQEVEDGIATFIHSRDQAEFLWQSVGAAEGALKIALLQYREGIADFTTVLTAEQNLYQAQNNLALATGSIALGLIKTYRALGGGWQIREGRDFVPAATQREMADRTNWGTLLTPDLLRPQAPGLPSPEDRGPPIRLPEW
ncbi:MAG TPA: efflux transporter outer membrane subunit [Candidatus Binatia bacterium]|nr:efflux transporter outer membrane subunit [Candidatus Binatia bacterium]